MTTAYMPCRSPWALNAGALDLLRKKVEEGAARMKTAKFKALPWDERTRFQQEVKALRRQLTSAELEEKLKLERQQAGQRVAVQQGTSAPEYAPTVAYFAGNQDVAQRVVFVAVHGGRAGGGVR